MINDTSGFYKQDDDHLLYAPNFVHGPGFDLLRETHDATTVDGWTWYDNANDAYVAAGIPSILTPEDDLDDLTVAIIESL